MNIQMKLRNSVCVHPIAQKVQMLIILRIVEYAELEALDISKLDQPGGKQALAEQVLKFINKNGDTNPPCSA